MVFWSWKNKTLRNNESAFLPPDPFGAPCVHGGPVSPLLPVAFCLELWGLVAHVLVTVVAVFHSAEICLCIMSLLQIEKIKMSWLCFKKNESLFHRESESWIHIFNMQNGPVCKKQNRLNYYETTCHKELVRYTEETYNETTNDL